MHTLRHLAGIYGFDLSAITRLHGDTLATHRTGFIHHR